MKQVKFRWINWLHIFIAAILGIGITIGSIYVLSLIDEGPFFLKVLPIPFILVGLFLIYYCLAICLNTSTVSKCGEDIFVKTRPIYWHKSISVKIVDINRVKVVRSHRPDEYLKFSYEIAAEMIDGTEKTIVPSSIPIEHNNSLKLKEHIEMILLEKGGVTTKNKNFR